MPHPTFHWPRHDTPAATAGLITFAKVPGSWSGNDYKSVSVTEVRDGAGFTVALLFMTHMNVDFDGAPNAYGPPGFDALDSLEDAGKNSASGYYGLMAVDPHETIVLHGKKVLLKDHFQLDLETDAKQADKKGRLPIKQKSGPYKGFYVSTTSKRNPNGDASIYEQSHYLDSSAVPYYATSYGIAQKGFGADDLGLALRLDRYKTASFTCLAGEGHKAGSPKAYALGECSYKVFLDIGGVPKKRTQKYADNNFPTIFMLFPGSKSSPLWRLSYAANSYDFAKFIAMQALVDRRSRGKSALDLFNRPANARLDGSGMADFEQKMLWPAVSSITAALRPFGYNPEQSAMAALL